MEVLRVICNAFSGIIPTIFTSNDMDIMSSETRKILSNDKDREKYINAVHNLRKHPETPQKFTLSNDEEVILTR